MHFSECIIHLLQKNSSKYKFGSPILDFGSVWLEISTRMTFFKQHMIILFWIAFRTKESFTTETLIEVQI